MSPRLLRLSQHICVGNGILSLSLCISNNKEISCRIVLLLLHKRRKSAFELADCCLSVLDSSIRGVLVLTLICRKLMIALMYKFLEGREL